MRAEGEIYSRSPAVWNASNYESGVTRLSRSYSPLIDLSSQ